MRKIFRLRWCPLCSILFGLACALPVLYVVAYTFEPKLLAKYSVRAENVILKLSGKDPTRTSEKVGRISTTFVDLAGEIFDIPGDRWRSGGGLTVWNDELLVLDRDGGMYVLTNSSTLQPIDIEVPQNGASDYRKVAASPEYAALTHKTKSIRYNDVQYVKTSDLHGVVLSYTFFDADRICYGTRLAWLELPSGIRSATDVTVAAKDWEIVFQTEPCLELNPDRIALDGLMAGGRMVFRSPSTIIVTVGDYHMDGVHGYDGGIQSDESDYGKVIAFDLLERTARHVSKGHRNAQGIAIDNEDRIWVVEHGMRGGDELNLIEEGENYGWPFVTLGTLYSKQPYPSTGEIGRHENYKAPVYSWLPSAAVSSLMFIDGFDPAWDGDLLAGSLSSPDRGRALFRIRIEEGRVLFAERIPLGRRVRYLTQFGPDKIAVWLDNSQLVIFTVEPRKDRVELMATTAKANYSEDHARKVIQLLRRCNECHSFDPGENQSGPSLYRVVGRPIAGTPYGSYSAALSAKSSNWTVETLTAYITNPSEFAPGTSMSDQGVSDAEAVAGLVEMLELLPELTGGEY